MRKELSRSGVRTAVAAVAMSALAAGQAGATADGPDHFRVRDVPDGGGLEMRAGPGPDHPETGTIGAGRDGLRNLGCIGGLTLAEWERASEAEREAAARSRWCKVGLDNREGWVEARFLAEGHAPEGPPPPVSFWRLVSSPAGPSVGTAYLAFGTDGSVSGTPGCNRIRGSATVEGERIDMSGPFAGTQMFCGATGVMEQEGAVLAALPEVASWDLDLLRGRLVLEDAAGGVLLVFAPMSAPEGP